MPLRLIVSADIHGYYSAWKKIIAKLKTNDLLIIAGDTFGTRYPDQQNPDYRPEDIRSELNDLEHLIVYGNCDIPQFSPGLTYTKTYFWENKKILIAHGDSPLGYIPGIDLIISGHTHVPMLEYSEGAWSINPGSPARPRAHTASYAVITSVGIQVLDLHDTALITADFASKVVQQKPALLRASLDRE
jgi:putative phosphoesterase